MYRDNPSSQIEIFATLKSSLLHHLLEGFLVRVHADRFCQIAITFFILGEQFANL
jgi:hypothetical protein